MIVKLTWYSARSPQAQTYPLEEVGHHESNEATLGISGFPSKSRPIRRPSVTKVGTRRYSGLSPLRYSAVF